MASEKLYRNTLNLVTQSSSFADSAYIKSIVNLLINKLVFKEYLNTDTLSFFGLQRIYTFQIEKGYF